MSHAPGVIVIEDQHLLAESLADVLVKLASQALGSAANLRDAMDLAADQSCDFVVVDFALHGQSAFPVLDRLQDRGVPFVLATGAAREAIPTRHMSAICVSKPYDMHGIRRTIRTLADTCDFSPWPENQDGVPAVLQV